MTEFVISPPPDAVAGGRRQHRPLSDPPRLLRRAQLRGACPRDGQGSDARAAVLLHEARRRGRSRRGRRCPIRRLPRTFTTRSRSSWRSATAASTSRRKTHWAWSWGYGVGVDLTRRDIQDTAKKMSRPWDWAKGLRCVRTLQSAPGRSRASAIHRRGVSGWKSMARSVRKAICRADLADRRRHQLRLARGRTRAR